MVIDTTSGVGGEVSDVENPSYSRHGNRAADIDVVSDQGTRGFEESKGEKSGWSNEAGGI